MTPKNDPGKDICMRDRACTFHSRGSASRVGRDLGLALSGTLFSPVNTSGFQPACGSHHNPPEWREGDSG